MGKRTFKDIAREKQADYFKTNYGIEKFASVKRKPRGSDNYKEYPVVGLLESEDANKGIIFYEGYRKEILKKISDLISKGKYAASGMMRSHTLRSEHIPWNLFFPMNMSDNAKECAKSLFNDIIKETSSELPMITEIKEIRIEYAPDGKENYLADDTSFDTYISYIADDGKKGGIGIEVKYTEEGYRPGNKEIIEAIKDHKNKENKESGFKYWPVMKKSNYYKPEADNGSDDSDWSPLVKDDLRQIWRNHLLGASMIQHGDINHFLSIHLYPSGNTHFHGKDGAVEKYRKYLLNEGLKTWNAVTFEELFKLIRKHFTDEKSLSWVKYLEERYLF